MISQGSWDELCSLFLELEGDAGCLYLNMKETSLSFDIEGFDGGIGSRHIGNHIEITYQGCPVMGFDATELVARDFTIASLLLAGLQGKTVAALCYTRPSRVSEVKRKIRDGGYQALSHHPGGRRAKLVGSDLSQVRKLRRSGQTIREISEKFKVSPACVFKAVKGIPHGGEPQQETLDGVDEPLVDSSTRAEVENTLMTEALCEHEPQVKDSQLPEVEDFVETFIEVPAEDRSLAEDAVFADDEMLVEDAMLTDDEALAEDAVFADDEMPVEDDVEIPSEARFSPEPTMSSADSAPELPYDQPEELLPGQPLPAGPAEHSCRYAGTLLIIAAVRVLGLFRALNEAHVVRPGKSLYKSGQALVALLAAWASGFGSLEAMHERDARGLGVVLGLERSPSVRTLHRAIAQMVVAFNPIKWGIALLRGLKAAVGMVPRIFGVDGHFKPYFGKERIDKGYNTKRRIAERGLSDVLIHDEQGRIWSGVEVGAGDRLSEHLQSSARRLRRQLGIGAQVVLGFDTGGFCFVKFDALDRENLYYIGWVPATVKLPDLLSIAPPEDGVGEQRFEHADLSADHHARLLVRRDGEALVPALTNLPETVSAREAVEMLKKVRGAQENDIKSARSFAHIDRLVDRGSPRRAPDDRLVDNPIRAELVEKRRQVRVQLKELSQSEPISAKDHARLDGKLFIAEATEGILNHKISGLPVKVPRVEMEPDAKRAWLKTKNRSLLQPLKYVLANGRRWLLSELGRALAPSDHEWDQNAMNRTLESLIRAPGTVCFGTDQVQVTLDLPLPPQPHARLALGLVDLDKCGLLFADGRRRVVFRLAPRPTRQALPSAQAPHICAENSK